MLVYLSKNEWVYNWLGDRWKDEMLQILNDHPGLSIKTITEYKRAIGKLLEEHGYRYKVTSNHDLIVVMSEEEYIFLKLKYE